MPNTEFRAVWHYHTTLTLMSHPDLSVKAFMICNIVNSLKVSIRSLRDMTVSGAPWTVQPDLPAILVTRSSGTQCRRIECWLPKELSGMLSCCFHMIHIQPPPREKRVLHGYRNCCKSLHALRSRVISMSLDQS